MFCFKKDIEIDVGKMICDNLRQVQDLAQPLTYMCNQSITLNQHVDTSLCMCDNHDIAKWEHARHVIRIDDKPPLIPMASEEGIEEANKPLEITSRYNDNK